MTSENIVKCPVCHSKSNYFYISTNALMHKANSEKYNFNFCNDCETVFLTNPVLPTDLDKYYTENYLPYRGANAWGKFSSFVKNNQKQLDLLRVNLVKKYIKINDKSIHILDVGCGNPSFLSVVQKKLQIKCSGIDFTDAGWKGENFTELNLTKSSIEDFQTTELFDVITLWHYLEHDYNPQKTIEKLYNCLKPGGKIIIEVPDYNNIIAKQQNNHWQGWHSPRHISLFSKKSFSVLFSKDKWNIVKHLRYGTLDAFTLWWLGKMEKKGIDWSGSMEGEFWRLVFLKVVTFPFFIFEKIIPMGVQIIIVEKK